jgi:outer membrane protein assembly factor BamB
VIWGSRVYVTTAVSEGETNDLRTGLYGDVDSVDDESQHEFCLICLDKETGQVLWQRTAYKSVPAVKRHLKSTHANPTVATDGERVIAFFGSEGLYCFDTQGDLKWSRQFGLLDSGWFYDRGYQWGFGSSPVIHRNLVFVQCDVQDDSFLAALDVDTGDTVWKVDRDEIPTWSTPTVCVTPDGPLVVTNGTRFVRGNDAESGRLKWQLGDNSEIAVPTPFVARQLIFVASGYRPVQPIRAVRLLARGDLTKSDKHPSDEPAISSELSAADGLAWSHPRGGPYMPTPIVYREYLYTCANNGVVTCYHATTGTQIKRRRLRGGSATSFVASPVAGDGHLYLTSEEGDVFVLKAGPELATSHVNPLGEPCLATPAISEGVIFFRTKDHLVAVDQSLSFEELKVLEARDPTTADGTADSGD